MFLQGDTVASCDSYGNVKLWDVRTVSPMVSFDVGPHPANKLAFDPSGACPTASLLKTPEIISQVLTIFLFTKD